MSKTERSLWWATIAYPESCKLDAFLSAPDRPSYALSPLHDADKTTDGKPKKAHYHLLVKMDSLKSQTQMLAYFSAFGFVGAEQVKSPSGYARYLTHSDDADKAQYSPSDIRYERLDMDALTSVPETADLRISKIVAIQQLITDNGVTSYAQLCNYLAIKDKDLLDAVIKNSGHFFRFMRSIEYDARS